MNVTYTFRQDSYEVFPPYTHHYDDLVTNKSFLDRSLIFLYRYVICECNPKMEIIPSQFFLYDKNGKMIDSMDQMMGNEKILVYIETPIKTLNYSYLDIKEIENFEPEDFPVRYYWVTTLQNNQSFALNGISRLNGKLVDHCIYYYDNTLPKNVNLTSNCIERLDFLFTRETE